MDMLLQVRLECLKPVKESCVGCARPCGRLKTIGDAIEFSDNMRGGLVFLNHHEDRLRNRAETGVRGRVYDRRVLIHLRYEGEEYLLFLFDVRIEIGAQAVEQRLHGVQFRSAIAALGGEHLRHFKQLRQLLAHTPVMNADDMLNQAADGQGGRVCRGCAGLIDFGIRELLKNLIYRELQFRACPFEWLAGLRAQVYVEALQDCRRS